MVVIQVPLVWPEEEEEEEEEREATEEEDDATISNATGP
jgi:hypothetical protein